jgi:hypothetical protein
MHRGWTLQELLAPKSVEFYDSNWHGIGTKSTFATTLAEVTGIALGALKGAPLSSFTVAHRMSWAAQRKTTRSEDTSYCLFGLFGVNLPLLYGEGEERAFIRLQEEILKVTEDYTIFAWTDAAGPVWDPVTHGPFIAPPGLLATSVTLFRDLKLSQELNLDHWLLESARHSDLIKSDAMLYADQPPMLTSRGLRITLLVQGGREGLSAREIRAQFYCLLRTRDGTLQQKPLVLHLRSSGQHNLYQRITRGALGLSIMESHQLDPFVPTTIYVEQEQKHSASITQILNKISPATMFELTLQGVEIVNSTPSIRYEAQNSFAGAPLQFSRPFAVLDPSSGCAVMLVRGFSKYALVGVGFLNGQSWCVVDAADESDFSELDKKMHTLSSSIDMVLPNLFCDGTSFNYESVLINATVKRRPSRIVYIAPGYGARFNLYCLSITALQH